MESKGKFILNLHTGKIHDGENPCGHARRIAEENCKWFDSFGDAVNYFEGNKKRGIRCAICLREKITGDLYTLE